MRDRSWEQRNAQKRRDSAVRNGRLKKRILKTEAGGKCQRCGYSRALEALEFHHLDALTKKFSIAHGNTRSLEGLRAEASKCVLLCANCHVEVHFGAPLVLGDVS